MAACDPGGLLRHLDPTLLPAAIKAAKEGAGSDFIPGLHRSEPEDVPLNELDDGGDEVDGEDEVRTTRTEAVRVREACALEQVVSQW